MLDLEFGKCKLQVQVPEKGGVSEAKDLVGKKVVTSFMGLTVQYFARLEGKELKDGFNDKKELKTKIESATGSIELVCALGWGDGVVDLVGSFTPFFPFSTKDRLYSTHSYFLLTFYVLETGDTMRAAGLKAIDTVATSTAVLVKSKHASNETLVNLIASRIRGVISKLFHSPLL